MPDHSVLLAHISLNSDTDYSNVHQLNDNRSVPTAIRYKLNHIPVDFMERDLTRRALLEIIERFKISRDSQDEIDSIYRMLCETIIQEMNHCIPRMNATKMQSHTGMIY